MKLTEKVEANDRGTAQAAEIAEKALKERGIKGKELMRAVLAVEESAGGMAAHAEKDGKITIRIRSFLGTTTIELLSRGEEYNPTENIGQVGNADIDELSDAGQDILRSILLRSLTDGLKYRHRGGVNLIHLTVTRSKRAFLYQTLGALALGVIVGLLLTASPAQGFADLLNTYLLIPVKTMYMNALKMVVAPVVFFSIVSCIVQFSDLSELGRIGGRVISLYLLTTCIAVAVGLGAFYIFQPGSPLSSDMVIASAESITSKTMDVSIKDTIVGIVPSNFIQPFLNADMLQLIFLAVICGVAAGSIGRYSNLVKDIFGAFNDLFLKVTTIIISTMPVAIFCSICSMLLKTGLDALVSVLSVFGVFLFGLVGMMLVYCLLILLSGLNPIPFVRKYAATMLQVFSMASSNAAIPVNMDSCNKLGISKKIYSLSIPLGATLNMDGTCVHLAVFSLALAKIYEVPVSGGALTSIILSIIVLSMGAPGVAGAGLICLSVLLTQMGVPVEAIGLVMGIDPLIGMFRCMSNCLGDAAVSMIVAKKENALDIEMYRG